MHDLPQRRTNFSIPHQPTDLNTAEATALLSCRADRVKTRTLSVDAGCTGTVKVERMRDIKAIRPLAAVKVERMRDM